MTGLLKKISDYLNPEALQPPPPESLKEGSTYRSWNPEGYSATGSFATMLYDSKANPFILTAGHVPYPGTSLSLPFSAEYKVGTGPKLYRDIKTSHNPEILPSIGEVRYSQIGGLCDAALVAPSELSYFKFTPREPSPDFIQAGTQPLLKILSGLPVRLYVANIERSGSLLLRHTDERYILNKVQWQRGESEAIEAIVENQIIVMGSVFGSPVTKPGDSGGLCVDSQGKVIGIVIAEAYDCGYFGTVTPLSHILKTWANLGLCLSRPQVS